MWYLMTYQYHWLKLSAGSQKASLLTGVVVSFLKITGCPNMNSKCQVLKHVCRNIYKKNILQASIIMIFAVWYSNFYKIYSLFNIQILSSHISEIFAAIPIFGSKQYRHTILYKTNLSKPYQSIYYNLIILQLWAPDFTAHLNNMHIPYHIKPVQAKLN